MYRKLKSRPFFRNREGSRERSGDPRGQHHNEYNVGVGVFIR